MANNAKNTTNAKNTNTTPATAAKKTTILYAAEFLTEKKIDFALLTNGREIAIKGKNGKRAIDIYNRTNAIRIYGEPATIAKIPASLIAKEPDGTPKRINNAAGNLKTAVYVNADVSIKALEKLLPLCRTLAEKAAAEKNAAAPAPAKGKDKAKNKGKDKPAADKGKDKANGKASGKGKPAAKDNKPAEKPAPAKATAEFINGVAAVLDGTATPAAVAEKVNAATNAAK